jgi:DNA polymerase III delta prime subunit
MTWAPGLPAIIEGRLISDGGWIEKKFARCFNLYRPPTIKPGDASKASPWLDHVRRVYPEHADHIIKYLAHRAQKPQEKPNHALLLGGPQGIGKDTLLEPLKHAIGPWNFSEVSPQQMLGRFNGFVKSVALRINEARDLGDVDRYKFYDHLKAYTAAPPDVLRVDEKHLREHSVMNVTGVIITTNHKADGVYLPADDRRHFVAWSELKKTDFDVAYWNGIWSWYENGGYSHVTAYLRELDISDFNAKAPPPKTAAFWDIVAANHSPENSELADALDLLGNPDAVTIDSITSVATAEFVLWLRDRKSRRQIPHRFEECGYAPVRSETAEDGLWKVRGKRTAVYARRELSKRDQLAAATALTR